MLGRSRSGSIINTHVLGGTSGALYESASDQDISAEINLPRISLKINQLKEFRRFAPRYDIRTVYFTSLIHHGRSHELGKINVDPA